MKAVYKKKRFLFQLNHPAHYHLFKNTIKALSGRGHSIKIAIKDKDILKELVRDYDFVQLSTGYRKKNICSIIGSVVIRDMKLLKIAKEFKPDLMIGTSPEIGHISMIEKSPALFFGEDDVNLSLSMYLGAMTCYPLFNTIISPYGVNNSIWKRKTVYYHGFQELSYLHPNRFQPYRSKVEVPLDKKYFFIRFANLRAYHDINAKGISDTLASKLIEILKSQGEVLISSERALPAEFQDFEFQENKQDIHHYLYYANLFIGDSQTMAAEAGVLGTPFIRYNDFVGKISYLNELEYKYKLGFGYKTNQTYEMLNKIQELANMVDIKNEFQKRREKMLSEKIDVSAFMVWFIENYPDSATKMKANPDYQYNFK